MKKVQDVTQTEMDLIKKGFGENANVEEVVMNYNGHCYMGDRKGFTEYLSHFVKITKINNEIKEESKKYLLQAKEEYTALFSKYDLENSLDVLMLLKEAQKIMGKRAKEENDTFKSRVIYEGYRDAFIELKKQLKSPQPQKPVLGITGPIYDDDGNPTYYDENMNEI